MNSSEDLESLFTLPNGMQVCHSNSYESDLLYKEIFEEQSYLKNGIKLNKKTSCVVDVGANIGLFALFVNEVSPKAKIICVEPSPMHCWFIEENCSGFDKNCVIVQKGLSDKEGIADFTLYPGYSLMSGFHADAHDDRMLLASSISSQMLGGSAGDRMSDAMLDWLLEGKLDDPQTFECELTTLSAVIEEEGLKKIDLLKVDAEKAETGIMKGICDKDWEIIQQVFVQVHSHEDAKELTAMLKGHGFDVIEEQEPGMEASGISNLYAIKK
jgi:FkbM family methyltransferase